MVGSTKKPEEMLDSEPITGTEATSAGTEKQAQGAAAGTSAAPDKNQEKAPDFSKENWDKSEKKEPWNSTAAGRFAIRTFSRGVMGAMFFTAGGHWARKMLPKDNVANHPYRKYNAVDTTFSDTINQRNPLQFIAKTIDTFAGAPIAGTVNLWGGSGLRATHFKPNKYQSYYPKEVFPGYDKVLKPYNMKQTPQGELGKVYGRSLGEEATFLTWDFFCASIGDAMGRDIAGWFDPAVKKDWMDDKGNVVFPKAVESLCKTAWRYVSYNGGEDWAVAIPYAYFVRGHRALMDKVSPGYRYESDISLNASSLKMSHLASPHQVAGSYALESMIDYQNRFTVYNIGTLMYRELYDKAAHALRGEHVNLYGAPDAPVDPNKSFMDKTSDVLKWMARSAVKGFICMTPAVPFFSITRATQNRNRALFIDPSRNAAMGFLDKDGKPHYVEAGMVEALSKTGRAEHGLTMNTPISYSHFIPDGHDGVGQLSPMHTSSGGIERFSAQMGNPIARPGFDYYALRHNMVENFFSRMGRIGEQVARSFDGIAGSVDRSAQVGGIGQKIKWLGGLMPGDPARGIAGDNFSRFTRSTLNASMSYTPYMYMKAETARLWDTGKMDYAIERMIDGATQFKWGEFKAGVGETWNALLHKPFADTAREAEAKRRIKIDSSAADAETREDAEQAHRQQIREIEKYRFRKEQAEALHKPFAEGMEEVAKKHNIKPREDVNLSWRERAMQGKAENNQVVSTENTPKNHADREEMRKFLEEAKPLTPSVH